MATHQTESGLEKWAKALAASKGVIGYKFRSVNKRGVPDMIFFYNGRTMLVEFKSPSGLGRLSPLQEKEIQVLRAPGMMVRVVHDKELFEAALTVFIRGETKC